MKICYNRFYVIRVNDVNLRMEAVPPKACLKNKYRICRINLAFIHRNNNNSNNNNNNKSISATTATTLN